MNITTKILTLLILGLLPSFSVGQKLDFYEFSVVTAYLPSCGSQSEIYLKVDNKVQRGSSAVHWKHCKKTKKRKLPKDESIEKAIDLLDSLNRLEEFTFTINIGLIDSLKARHFWKKTYQITDQDIDNFFSRHDTVTLKLKVVKQEILEGIVIDGAPYWFDLKLKREGQDTVKYSFTGNFLDGVQTSNIGNWIPMYLTFKEYKLFDSIKLMDEYFNDKKLESILFRFITWTKKEE